MMVDVFSASQNIQYLFRSLFQTWLPEFAVERILRFYQSFHTQQSTLRSTVHWHSDHRGYETWGISTECGAAF